MSYLYNDSGQRTRKTVYQGDGISIDSITIYHYDQQGYLITETTETGALIKDYIWQQGLHPVAQIDASMPVQAGMPSEGIIYLHTDHLLTNRLATDATRKVIWRWEGEAFGNTPASGSVSVNLRFPGQYYDAETNLHYNHFRYYDPELGRYITSDPIGLRGGMNTYGYVVANPNKFYDLYGLDPSLRFDGSTTTAYDSQGNQTNQWPSVSGLPSTGPEDSYNPNSGPISEGAYSVDPSESNYDRWWKPGWGSTDSWGDVRTPIEPKPGTYTNDRDGFYFHGGSSPGSLGCVDLTNSNNDFHDWLQQQDGPIDLTVDYPNYQNPY